MVMALGLATLTACDTMAPAIAQRPATSPAEKPQSLPTVKMRIANADFTIEVADEDREHQIGMMHRDSNPANHGMIFIFPDEQPRGFWMRNTRIPLDILYINQSGKVVSIKPAQPLDERTIPSDGPAKYVIELNLGRAAAIGLKAGDTIPIPDSIKEPKK